MKQKKAESEIIGKLERILKKHRHERVCVVGTTCTGKSYLIKHISDALDMDDIIFPQLTQAQEKYVMQKPWNEKVGKTMIRLVRERVKIEPGKPVFGTVVIPSDYIVYLKISDSLLEERTKKRNKKYSDAKNMQAQIENEIHSSRIPYTELNIS